MANFAETLDHNAAVRKGRNTKPTLAHIRIEKAENGGHSVEHHFESGTGAYHEPKTYVFGPGEGRELAAHLKEHLGIKLPETHGAPSEEPEKESDEPGKD